MALLEGIMAATCSGASGSRLPLQQLERGGRRNSSTAIFGTNSACRVSLHAQNCNQSVGFGFLRSKVFGAEGALATTSEHDGRRRSGLYASTGKRARLIIVGRRI